MTKTAPTSLRLSKELKRQIARIAARERRTPSNTMSALLQLAVDSYAASGTLNSSDLSSQSPQTEFFEILASDDVLMQRIADMIAERILTRKDNGRLHQQAPTFLRRQARG